MEENNQIIIYQGEDGETVWLSLQQMAELYPTNCSNIVQHIRNIYADGELEEAAICKNFLQVRQDGNRQVLDLYATAVYYNPHSDISVEF